MTRFPAKILLAGEYAILQGGMAVAIPWRRWGGQWSCSSRPHQRTCTTADLSALRQRWSPQICGLLDLSRFDADLANGMLFDSNIPWGAGLGSSGALCAAIWAHYRIPSKSWKEVPISTLQQELRLLETPIHGTSSGLDPLISLTGQSFICRAGQWQRDEFFPSQLAKMAAQRPLFLLDSGQPRQTAPLVTRFQQWLQSEEGRQQISTYLLYNEDWINQTLFGQLDLFDLAWQRLSRWQRHYMDYLIPPSIATLWDQGLHTQSYFLKLCGAGGGGFFLGMSLGHEQIQQFGQKVPFSIEVLDLTSFALK